MVALLSVAILVGMLALPATAADDRVRVRITTVATGLDAPRGMTIGPHGALYVAEAGEGGDDYCFTHPMFGELCGGPSGAVTKIRKGSQVRILSGLPSIALPDGSNASGPEDISRQRNGKFLIPIGFGGDPAVIPDLRPGGFPTGWLIRATARGDWTALANISEYELLNNPAGGFPGDEVDSNPKAVAATPWGSYVVDAGGNDLMRVGRGGRISLLAVFAPRFVPFPGVPDPGIPMQSVPDSIAVGRDGAAYVGELTGFPFPPGKARIFRVTRDGDKSVYARGFTNIIDLAFGPDGSLYVLEIATNGLESGDPTGGLWRIPRGGGEPQLLLTEPLFLPGGMAIGHDGTIYVSTCAPCPNTGEVLRIKIQHD
jgi:hypothetical protein